MRGASRIQKYEPQNYSGRGNPSYSLPEKNAKGRGEPLAPSQENYYMKGARRLPPKNAKEGGAGDPELPPLPHIK